MDIVDVCLSTYGAHVAFNSTKLPNVMSDNAQVKCVLLVLGCTQVN